jgi:hypothetical protein
MEGLEISVHSMSIWNVWQPFGTFCGHLVHIIQFRYVVTSGNPECDQIVRKCATWEKIVTNFYFKKKSQYFGAECRKYRRLLIYLYIYKNLRVRPSSAEVSDTNKNKALWRVAYVVVIVSSKGTENRGFESRQVVSFVFGTFCIAMPIFVTYIIRIVIVCESKRTKCRKNKYFLIC